MVSGPKNGGVYQAYLCRSVPDTEMGEFGQRISSETAIHDHDSLTEPLDQVSVHCPMFPLFGLIPARGHFDTAASAACGRASWPPR